MRYTIFCLSVLLFHVPVLVYQIDSLPIRLPIQLRSNNHVLDVAEYLGVGQLQGPEDIAYDKKSRIIYTGCADGSIKKIYIGKSKSSNPTKIESWVNTGGTPLGVALGLHNELIVADAYKGLLNVTKDDAVNLLTDEAEGLKFNLTEAVDVANNGMIYFTDASFKYGLEDFLLDVLGNEPHGRLMSFDPVTRKTKVLVRDIYLPSGVTVSPDQNHLIYCEFSKLKCSKYHIRGPKIGMTENFIDNLPGLPDNIRYDGLGHYWIGIYKKTATTGDGGIVATNLNGKILAYYTDTNLSLSGGNIIEDTLYCTGFENSFIITVDVSRLS